MESIENLAQWLLLKEQIALLIGLGAIALLILIGLIIAISKFIDKLKEWRRTHDKTR